jgi:LPXTG-site transpeptidase (sortase) family protein
LRDLFVFLILFLLGLAIWTTGLFPAVPVQAELPMAVEIEEQAESVESASERAPFVPGDQAPALGATHIFPEPARASERANRVKLPLQRKLAMGAADSAVLQRPELRIQRIRIPSLKVDAQVVDIPFNGETWDISSLGHDIARLGEVPGEDSGENMVLAGHFSIGWTELGPFRYISRLAVGAPILIYTDRMVYTYQVREHAVVGDQDERVLAHTSKPQLTLLTCETWDEEARRFLRRRVVIADLVQSEPLGQRTIQ